MRIMARTKTRVPYADEVEASGEPPEDLEALIREAKGEEERGTEDIIEVSFTMNYDIFKANFIPFLVVPYCVFAFAWIYSMKWY